MSGHWLSVPFDERSQVGGSVQLPLSTWDAPTMHLDSWGANTVPSASYNVLSLGRARSWCILLAIVFRPSIRRLLRRMSPMLNTKLVIITAAICGPATEDV